MSTTYAYNDALRKVTITNPYNEVTQLTRDTSQRLSRKDFGNGTYETYGYDSRNRPNSILLKNSGGATLSSQSYTYDNASNVTNHTQDGVSTTYGYDSIDQLTSETRSGYSASYTYDANGNRTSRTVNGLVESYTNDLGDKLTSVTWNGGYKNYAYDAAGRMTSVTTAAGVTTLNYDYEDRVTSISFAGGGYATNTYNGLDTRVGRTDKFNQPWTYKRDGAGVTAPLLADGNFNYTPGTSARNTSAGLTNYSHAGIKNGTRQTDTAQTVSASKQYDAFGNETSSTGTWAGIHKYGGPFGYQQDTDSGLKLLGHRYYDPSIGRFLTRDPTGDGRNWYSYCNNNPTSQVDADGLKKVLIVVGTGIRDPYGETTIVPGDMVLASFYALKYWMLGWDVQILEAPSEADVESALSDADGLVFIGHGRREWGRLQGGGPGKTGTTDEKLTPSLLRRALKKSKRKTLKFLILESCHMGQNPEWVSLADDVYAYDDTCNVTRRVKGWGQKGNYGPTRFPGARRPVRGGVH